MSIQIDPDRKARAPGRQPALAVGLSPQYIVGVSSTEYTFDLADAQFVLFETARR